MLPTYRAWSHPKAIRSPPYWAVCCQPTGLYVANLQGCMLPTYRAVCRQPTGPETTPKQFDPLHTGLYVANLQGLKPPQSNSIPAILGCMLPTYRAVCCQPRNCMLPWNQPKEIRCPPYWAVCRQPTGLKPPQSNSIPSILGCLYAVNLQGCMLPIYRAWNHPKQVHALRTGLYVTNQQGKATPFPPYSAVCCQPTGLYVANLQGCMLPTYRATPSYCISTILGCLMLSVCCQPTVLYVANLQRLKPPQSNSIPSILGCMSPTNRAKPLHSHHTQLYVANLQGCMPSTYRAWNHQSTTKVVMFQKSVKIWILPEEMAPYSKSNRSLL